MFLYLLLFRPNLNSSDCVKQVSIGYCNLFEVLLQLNMFISNQQIS